MTADARTLGEILDGSKNLQAFLRALRVGEGTMDDNGYRRIYGGQLFDDYAKHPGLIIRAGAYSSSASGAYQIINSTWANLVHKYGFTDFNPRTQDIAAVALIAGRNALADVVEGRIRQAVVKCNKEWASLPGSPYGQPVVTIDRFLQEYRKWGGTEEGEALHPLMGSVDHSLNQEKPVLPFIAAALPSLISAVPDLIKIFGANTSTGELSPTAVRNEKAAEAVMNVAKAALGARNEQEVVSTLQNNPDAPQILRDAVKDNWFQIVEVGGGITEARKAASAAQGTKNLAFNPAFVISVLLMLMPFMLLADVFYVHPEQYSADGLRTQIVTGVLMVISGIMGFWLGTSFSSGKKDDVLADVVRR